MNILVTGGAGFIGSHLVDRLIDLGHQVLVVDDLSTGREEYINKKAQFIKLDICDKKINNVFEDFQPNIVFHLAAQKYVKVSMEEPELDAQINIVGSINLFKIAKNNNTKKFIFVSTGGAIYDETAGIPSNEESRTKPISAYALSKLTFEKYLEMLSLESSIKWTVLRLANVYGPRQDPYGEGGVVAIFSENIIKGKTLFINGEGQQTRDYVYVGDVVSALVSSIDAKEAIYNISTNVETTVLELIEKFKKITNKDFAVEKRAAIAGEVMRSALDFSKAKEVLKWTPKYDLDRGLKETYQWFENK